MAAKKKPTIAWSKLTTTSGKATKVPTLLRELQAGGPGVEKVVSALAGPLVDDGSVSEAALPVAETLIEMIETGWSSDLVHPLAVLRYLVALGQPGQRDFSGLDLRDPDLKDLYDEPRAAALLEAVTGRLPLWTKLLEHPTASARAAVAHLIGLLSPRADHGIATLSALLSSDPDRGVRVSACIAIGQLTRASTHEVRARGLEMLRATRRDADPLVAGIAVVLVATMGDEVSSFGVELSEFFRALAPYLDLEGRGRKMRWPDVDWPRHFFSWNGGALDIWVFGILRVTVGGGAPRALSQALARAVAPAPRGLLARTRARVAWVDKLLDWHFEERTEPLSAAELNEYQRELLTLLSQDVHGANFRGYGIPDDTRSRRRWLGLDPPGVLERVVGSEKAPLWEILMPFLKEHMAAADPAPPLHASLQTFLRRRGVELTDDEWMDLWVEREAGAYGLPDHAPFPPAEEPGCLPSAAVVSGTIRWLERIPTDPYELRWTSGSLFATLARVMTGESPPALDGAFNFCGRPALVREGFAALPLERRERIADRALGDPRCTNVSLLASFPELAPRAAQRLEQLSARGYYEPLERSDDPRFLEHIRAMPPLRGLNAD